MKKKDRSKDRTRKYRERLKEKQVAATEQASEEAQYRTLNLCSFAEIAYETPARTREEEIHIHRMWLQAFRDIGMDEPDVLPGESLRDLARRTWQALLRSEKFGLASVFGDDVCYAMFSPSQRHFQFPFDVTRFPSGPLGEVIRHGAKPDWFDKYWRAPKDCTGDEPIETKTLPSLPPIPVKTSRPEPKRVKLPIESPVPSFDEPLAQARSVFPEQEFGTFGMTQRLPTE